MKPHPSLPASVAPRDPATVAYSVVIPVYGNEESIPDLTRRLASLAGALQGPLEAVFVIDGSPDRSAEVLAELLPGQPFESTIVAHSRNFGSFAAVRTGLSRARGRWIAVMAADLQEPPGLMEQFFEVLSGGEVDVVIGVRQSRDGDRAATAISSRLFWSLYRRLVQREMPAGGVDVFACTRAFCAQLVALEEANSSLVALTIWLGFRREMVPYDRQPREHGRSGWTLRTRLKYLSDSIYSFSDLPIRLLLAAGLVGMAASILIATVVLVARATGQIGIPGYTATVLVIAFFGALNLAGLGIIGAYVWRAFENTKDRPGAVVMGERSFVAREQ